MTLGSKVTLTSVLHRASWMVRLLAVRLAMVPVAPRRAAAADALAAGGAPGLGEGAAPSPRASAPAAAPRRGPKRWPPARVPAVDAAALAVVPPPPPLWPP